MITICKKHQVNNPYIVLTSDETKCKFCREELYERMEKFGIHDYKREMEEDKNKYLGESKEQREVRLGTRLIVGKNLKKRWKKK